MRTVWVQLAGVTAVLAAAGGAVALVETADLTGPAGGGSTFYPRWTALVLAGCALAGVLLTALPLGAVRRWAASVALVGGLQVLGTGVVGVRHLRPASGMGAVNGDLYDLVPLAAGLAVAGAVLAGAGGLVLRRELAETGDRLPGWARVALVALAVAAAVIGPALLALPHEDVMSWGAAGLMHVGPWAVGLVLAASGPRRVARALCVVVLVLTVLTVIGPNMAGLGLDGPRKWAPALLVALAATAVAGVAAHRVRRQPARAAAG